MGADESKLKPERAMRRGRSVALLMAGLAVLAVVVAPAAGGSTARAASGGVGSSCAHPWRASYVVGGPEGGFEGDQKRIEMNGTPRKLTWVVWPEHGNVICSVRIELADGKLGRPTKLFPYATPTPYGGEYREPHGPHSRLRAVFVTAAKSPVPPGSSCNYPVYNGQSVLGTPGEGADTKDFSVKVKAVSVTSPGEPKPGSVMTLRIEVYIHNPRVAICRAFMTIIPSNGNGETAKTFPVKIKPDGTSEDIEVPEEDAYSDVVFAWLR